MNNIKPIHELTLQEVKCREARIKDTLRDLEDTKIKLLADLTTLCLRKRDLEDNNMRHLLVNSIKCPDGTVLESRHVHDYQEHKQEDGRIYVIDGGLEYPRRLCSDTEYTDLSIYSDDSNPHHVVRKRFKWTNSLDKNGKRMKKPKKILLMDITDDHLIALINYTKEGYPEYINRVFVNEKKFRGV